MQTPMSDGMQTMKAQLFQGQTAMQNQGKPQSEQNVGQQQQQPQRAGKQESPELNGRMHPYSHSPGSLRVFFVEQVRRVAKKRSMNGDNDQCVVAANARSTPERPHMQAVKRTGRAILRNEADAA